MGMAAILVMWQGPFEQTFIPPSQRGSLWNLTSIGSVVSEEMFANVVIHTYGRQRATDTYKLTYEPKLTNEPKGSGELKIEYHLYFHKLSATRNTKPQIVIFFLFISVAVMRPCRVFHKN